MKEILILLIAIIGLFLFGCIQSSPFDVNDYNGVVMTMGKGGCFGSCPSYKLTINGDGKVTYEGAMFVGVQGAQTTTISKEKVGELVNEFRKANYFSLDDRYDNTKCSDASSSTTSITINGKTKSVYWYHCVAKAPPALGELEKRIYDIVNAGQWVEGWDGYDSTEIAAQTIKKGKDSKISERAFYVIDNDDDWLTFRKNLGDKELIEECNENNPCKYPIKVNFLRERILAITMGERNKEEYDLNIDKIMLSQAQWSEGKPFITLQISETMPKDSGGSNIITRPYHIIRFPIIIKESELANYKLQSNSNENFSNLNFDYVEMLRTGCKECDFGKSTSIFPNGLIMKQETDWANNLIFLEFSNVNQETYEKIISDFSSQFFSLNDEYFDQNISDYVIKLTIKQGDSKKSVKHFEKDLTIPPTLKNLEIRINNLNSTLPE